MTKCRYCKKSIDGKDIAKKITQMIGDEDYDYHEECYIPALKKIQDVGVIDE